MACEDLPDGGVMRLGLSSAAAPDAVLTGLLEACAIRGLDALELEEGHGHGLEPGLRSVAAPRDAAARSSGEGVCIAGFRVSPAAAIPPAGPIADPTDPAAGEGAEASAWTRFSEALGAPILVPVAGGVELQDVRRLAEQGVPVWPVLPPDPFGRHRIPEAGDASRGTPLAWDADPTTVDVGDAAARLLDRIGGRLRHVRLLGGGPEATEQEGPGVGALAARAAWTALAECLP